MKKLIIYLMAFLFSISLVFGQNKTKVDLLIKSEKEIKEDIKETKEELRMEKKQLKAVEEARRKLEGTDVNSEVKKLFTDEFGDNTDVVWERKEFYDVATFTNDGIIKKAYYDFNLYLIGATWFVTFADLPERAQKEIKEKYKDYEIGKVVYYDDNESVDVDFFIYESQFRHEDNYFVELAKDSKHIILKVNIDGDVSFFKNIE